MTTLDIARAIYRDISLYSPNRTPCAIDLSDNTNLWGIPPAAERAIREAMSSTVTRYPPLYTDTLKAAMAEYVGATPDMIVTGCGSDDVLDSAIRAFGEPGDLIAYPEPSFAMIPIFAKMNGLRCAGIPLTATYDVDPDAFIATGAKIMYLCSPNNPTGNALPSAIVREIIARAPGLVIVDEAYIEFADDRVTPGDNVLVTRTMSKAFGLAGLRIGYAVGDPAIITEVEKSRGPYKVNGMAERAAVAALTEDLDWVRARIADARTNRERLAGALRDMGLSPLPSAANFLLVPVNGAVAIDTQLRARGIAVRPFVALPGIGDALRISVGPWEMMDACLTALREVLA